VYVGLLSEAKKISSSYPTLYLTTLLECLSGSYPYLVLPNLLTRPGNSLSALSKNLLPEPIACQHCLSDPTLSLLAKSGLHLTQLTTYFLPLLTPYPIWLIWSVTRSFPYLTMTSLLPYHLLPSLGLPDQYLDKITHLGYLPSRCTFRPAAFQHVTFLWCNNHIDESVLLSFSCLGFALLI
jgi:hypothetical protein